MYVGKPVEAEWTGVEWGIVLDVFSLGVAGFSLP